MNNRNEANTDRNRSGILLDHLKRLRRLYVINRLLQFLSIALLAGLFLDLGAIIFHFFWSLKLPFPFLFEILFFLLILKELPRWRLEKIAVMVDQRFHLKDRLYSHLWYAKNKNVPEKVRSAQLREASSSIDFDILVKSSRIRIPVMLVATIPLFLMLLYLSWNAEYMPPGITTRIISLTKYPAAPNGPSSTSSTQAVREDQLSPLDSKREGTDRSKKEDQPSDRENLTAKNNSASSSTPAGVKLSEDDGTMDGKGSTEEGGGGAGGNAAGMKGPGSENMISNPVSQTVSAPVPPNLATHASQSFLEFPDASKFLDLVPGQGSASLADLDEGIINIFEENLQYYPDRYREHLQNYYWELKKWSQNK